MGGGYKLLGFLVWHGARWYLRRRLPSRRKLALMTLVALAGVGVAAALVRRAVA